jgi:hypothetical protein
MKTVLIAGAMSLTLGACATTLPPFPDVTTAYVQQPTPLPDVAAMTAARVAALQPPLNSPLQATADVAWWNRSTGDG